MQPETIKEKDRFNPTLYAMIGIPAAAVLASFFTFYLALREAEPELPAQYVSEGEAVEADFARAAIAREAGLGVQLQLEAGAAGQTLVARIEMREPTAALAAADRLLLRLTHATQPKLDRELVLERSADSLQEGPPQEDLLYRAAVTELAEGPWLVQIEDPNAWRLRSRWSTTAFDLKLGY